MKVEIVNHFSPQGKEIFYWVLYDGPADSSDKVTGYATSLEEALNKIHHWRQRISNDYLESFSSEGSRESLGDGASG